MKILKPKISKEIIRQVPVSKLDSIIAENNYNIIDVRDQKGIEKQGSIPGAINIPFDTIERAIDKNHDDFNPIFKNDGPYLFCCTGGVMSYMAAIKAQERGIKNVCNLDGGHSAWLKLTTTATI
ncbi:rhodanese-like domain-containing protein [Yeosuana sp. MJ-SS3]|uniref:Rhodanese-like domain-containing protein n=1 Tax=Gilvirhabdus luticola TaxID=3079858 RepID=A0ABU3U3Q2_9FLAO|nr:rhodanese-like domain-containing protein [Yeosuana sp. MJ-SS3]MDU8885037.1 rhodanese-like domain-containing protein [Yeosuana sp. MJ-SS3]